MYELLRLVEFAAMKMQEGKRLALATIIHTNGSSYRKKGTQMLVAEDLSYAGALSGGCVEKEVLRQSQLVFSKGENVVFEYDGRYKLGCNGRIYILVEAVSNETLDAILEQVLKHHQQRKPFSLIISKEASLSKGATAYLFGDNRHPVSSAGAMLEDEVLSIPPQQQLVIIGGEYDSVTLANVAAQTGMQVLLIVKDGIIHPLDRNVKMAYIKPEAMAAAVKFDEQTAIVLMTHSLSKDLAYLIELVRVKSAYLGVLGPVSRRETLLNDLMNYSEGLFIQYQEKLESLHGPVGLDIGAKTPEEISISILSEIIAVFSRKRTDVNLAQPLHDV